MNNNAILITGATGSFISAGTFASYLGAILMLMAPIKRLARVNEFVQTGIAAAASAFQILDETFWRPVTTNIMGTITILILVIKADLLGVVEV